MDGKITSDKRSEASRRNGRKSRGPITIRGKKRSSRNALKHGLLSNEVVISEGEVEEDAKQYNDVFNAHMEEFSPVGIHEKMLVKEIVDCRWRLRRVKLAEVGEIRKNFDSSDSDLRPRFEFGIFNSRAQRKLGAWEELRTQVEQGKLSAEAERRLQETCEEEAELSDAYATFRKRSHTTDVGGNQPETVADPDFLEAQRQILEAIEFHVQALESRIRFYKRRVGLAVTADRAANLVPDSTVLDRLLRYEAAINRQLYKAIHELERSQMRRSGNLVPAANQLDVT
jgi:hypothetical protein